MAREDQDCVLVPIPDAMLGPAHVARLLIKQLHDKRSQPQKIYKLNAEQLELIALYVSVLEGAFQNRDDKETRLLNPATVLMTIIIVGGGGCGKTEIITEI